jgi:hypothetical protein
MELVAYVVIEPISISKRLSRIFRLKTGYSVLKQDGNRFNDLISVEIKNVSEVYELGRAEIIQITLRPTPSEPHVYICLQLLCA